MWNAVPPTCTRSAAADRPTPERTYAVIQRVAELLGEDVCWLYGDSFHVRLPADGWTVAVTPDEAGRFRLEACDRTDPRSTVWCHDHDDARLAAIVGEMASEVAALAA